MVIKASSTKQIDALIAALSSDRPGTRDAAVARLTVMGARTVARLIAVALDTTAHAIARAASLKALEAIGDAHALDAVLQAIDDTDTTVSLAALEATRVFLGIRRGIAVVDKLTAVAIDRQRRSVVRIAAIRALGDLKPSTLGPLFAALRAEPDAEISKLAKNHDSASAAGRDPAEALKHAIEGSLPDDPIALRRAISANAAGLPLPLVGRLIERIREREPSETPSRRVEWMAARAAAHVALAARGSRLALYDLRETLEGADARSSLPVEFLTALTRIGDASCLEAIAAAYSKAAAPRGDVWWRDHLSDTFRAIVKREKVTRRHAVMKKIDRKWPEILKRV